MNHTYTRSSPPPETASSTKLPHPPLNVFISYKEKDAVRATKIRKELLERGGSRMNAFIAADSVGNGTIGESG